MRYTFSVKRMQALPGLPLRHRRLFLETERNGFIDNKLPAVFCADEANDLVAALQQSGYALVLEERGESLMRLDVGERFSAIADSLYKEMLTPRPTREKATKGPAHMEGSAE